MSAACTFVAVSIAALDSASDAEPYDALLVPACDFIGDGNEHNISRILFSMKFSWRPVFSVGPLWYRSRTP